MHFKIISIISYLHLSSLNIHKITGRNWVKGKGMAIAGKPMEMYHIILRGIRECFVLNSY